MTTFTSRLYRIIGSALSSGGVNGRLSILIYHRVRSDPDPLFPADTTAARFDAELKALKGVFNVLPLSEAVDKLQSNALPPRAAAITFDDGYADNAEVAIPILQRHGLTATFFIATKYLNGGRMFNDTIIEAIRHTPLKQIDLGHIGLGPLSVETVQDKIAAIHSVLPQVKYLEPVEREAVVAEIAQLAESTDRLPDNLMMTHEQVVDVVVNGMEVGGHTDSHPILAKTRPVTAVEEIQKGKRILEGLTGKTITLFAYPNGKPGVDYLPEHVSMLRDMGFKAAVSTHWGAASRDSDIYQLPRFTPWGGMRSFIPRLLKNLMQQEQP